MLVVCFRVVFNSLFFLLIALFVYPAYRAIFPIRRRSVAKMLVGKVDADYLMQYMREKPKSFYEFFIMIQLGSSRGQVG